MTHRHQILIQWLVAVFHKFVVYLAGPSPKVPSNLSHPFVLFWEKKVEELGMKKWSPAWEKMEGGEKGVLHHLTLF